MLFGSSRRGVRAVGALLLTLVLCPGTALAQRWFNVGPDSAPVSRLVVSQWNPQALYAIANNIPFRTTDGGAHWEGKPLYFGTPQTTLYSIAVDPFTPATVYVGTGSQVFKSTDGGSSWQRLEFSPRWVEALAVDPVTPTTLYASGYGIAQDFGLHKSTDGGVTWTRVTPLSYHLRAIAIDPWRPHIVYIADRGTVARSVDGGQSWLVLSNGLPAPGPGQDFGIADLAIDLWNPETVYLAAAVGPTYKSANGGALWEPVDSAATQSTAVAIDGAHQMVHAASTVSGIVRSADGGITWTPSPHNPTTLLVSKLVVDIFAPGTLYAASDQGVFKTVDGGETWVPANTGLRSSPVSSIAIDPWSAALYVAGSGGVHESRDFGLTWTARNAGLTPIPGPGNLSSFCVSVPVCGPTLNDIVLDIWNPGAIYTGGGALRLGKTSDGGLGWTAATDGLGGRIVSSLAGSPASAGTLYAGAGNGVFKTVDQGTTWTITALTLPADANVFGIVVDPQNSDIVFASASHSDCLGRCTLSRVWKTTDGGATWNPVPVPSPTTAVAIAPSDPSVLYGVQSGRVMRSTNGGASWIEVFPTGTFSIRAVAVDPWTPSTVYAAGSGYGTTPFVFKSVDGGDTWINVSDGLPEALGAFKFVTTLVVHPWFPSLVYAGTDDGVTVLVQ